MTSKAGQQVLAPCKVSLGTNGHGRLMFNGERLRRGTILARCRGAYDATCTFVVIPFVDAPAEDAHGNYLVDLLGGPVVLAHRSEIRAVSPTPPGKEALDALAVARE